MFSVRTPCGGLQAAVVKGGEVGGVGGSRLSLWHPQLKKNLVDLARLIAQPKGVAKTSVIRLNLLSVCVHGLHVGLGVLEGVGQHRVPRLEVIDSAGEVLVLDLVSLDLLPWCAETVGDEALDDLLNTVAVLERVYQSQLPLRGEVLWQLREEGGREGGKNRKKEGGTEGEREEGKEGDGR